METTTTFSALRPFQRTDNWNSSDGRFYWFVCVDYICLQHHSVLVVCCDARDRRPRIVKKLVWPSSWLCFVSSVLNPDVNVVNIIVSRAECQWFWMTSSSLWEIRRTANTSPATINRSTWRLACAQCSLFCCSSWTCFSVASQSTDITGGTAKQASFLYSAIVEIFFFCSS